MKSPNVAIVGVTGVVGREMLGIVEERGFPLKKLCLVASERSVGKRLVYQGKELPVENLEKFSFSGIDIVLSSPGAGVSRKYVPRAVQEGAVVIDNTSAFRMDPKVPLVVPEVNIAEIKNHQGIIANPNCSTIQLVAALKPLHEAASIKRIVVSTYQSVSGAGGAAIEELRKQVQQITDGEGPEVKKFPYQIAFNLIPHIDFFLDNGYTREEVKLVNETRKIMGDSSLRITATAVRVPVYISHSESVNIETERKLSVDEAREVLSCAPGVIVVDEPEAVKYPLPIQAAGRDEVFVGRIREDESIENGLNLWIVSDNLRKGAALNAVQIAEHLIER